MQPSDSTGPLLSKRQHRMLQDMGIDVFFARHAVNNAQTRSADQPESPEAQRRRQSGHEQALPSADGTIPQQPSPASAARAALASTSPMSSALKQQASAISSAEADPSRTSMDQTAAQASVETGLTIELSFVATPSLVWVGDGPLSELELRFLQDLAAGLHQAVTRTPLNHPVRNSEFRWPIVEASGTPERAVAVFCDKHQMLSPNVAVIGNPTAMQTLQRWLSDNTNHWLTVEALAQTAAQGESKRALWTQLVQHVLAAQS